MFFLEFCCFFYDPTMLTIWSLVSLPFLNPPWTSGSSQFTYCWSLAWRILSITLLVCKERKKRSERKKKVKSLSHVRLFVTPWTAAHQAAPSMGFSRKEYWSGVPLPSQLTVSSVQLSSIAQSCPTLSDPMDCGPPGCSIHGIFQARVLDWGAIAFFIGVLVICNT